MVYALQKFQHCLLGSHFEMFTDHSALKYLVNKRHVKVQYDKFVRPRRFSEGDLVLLQDQAKEPLGEGKFNPMWHGSYVVK